MIKNAERVKEDRILILLINLSFPIKGYGEKGHPPLVPKKAALRFTVELLGSWEVK